VNGRFDHDLNLAFRWAIVKRIMINAKADRNGFKTSDQVQGPRLPARFRI
jgi:hypothetical protein